MTIDEDKRRFEDNSPENLFPELVHMEYVGGEQGSDEDTLILVVDLHFGEFVCYEDNNQTLRLSIDRAELKLNLMHAITARGSRYADDQINLTNPVKIGIEESNSTNNQSDRHSTLSVRNIGSETTIATENGAAVTRTREEESVSHAIQYTTNDTWLMMGSPMRGRYLGADALCKLYLSDKFEIHVFVQSTAEDLSLSGYSDDTSTEKEKILKILATKNIKERNSANQFTFSLGLIRDK